MITKSLQMEDLESQDFDLDVWELAEILKGKNVNSTKPPKNYVKNLI